MRRAVRKIVDYMIKALRGLSDEDYLKALDALEERIRQWRDTYHLRTLEK